MQTRMHNNIHQEEIISVTASAAGSKRLNFFVFVEPFKIEGVKD